MHQGQLRVPGHLHMASATDLMADDRDALFAPHPQPVVMAEDLRRNFGAQFGELFPGFRARYSGGFEGLKFQEIFKDAFHRRMKVKFIQCDFTLKRWFGLNIFCRVFSMVFSSFVRAAEHRPI